MLVQLVFACTKGKSKVFYGLEPPSGEYTIPQNVGSIINLLAVISEVAQWGTPSCSRSQIATDNGVRDGRFN